MKKKRKSRIGKDRHERPGAGKPSRAGKKDEAKKYLDLATLFKPPSR